MCKNDAGRYKMWPLQNDETTGTVWKKEKGDLK